MLTIATPFYDYRGYSPYISSLVASALVLQARGVKLEYLTKSGDAYIENARNSLAMSFLASGSERLIFIDSDLSWEPDAICQLLHTDEEVTALMFRLKQDDAGYPCTIETQEGYVTPAGYAGPPVTTESGLIVAKQIATGFMKIKRSVFEKLIKADPENYYLHKGEKIYNFFGRIHGEHEYLGEDIAFCQRCREVGIGLYIEPRATLHHWGIKRYEGNFDNFLKRSPIVKRIQTALETA